MKNSKRMLAVIAASGLALGTLPGVANAQGSEDLLDLGVGLNIGDSVELGVDLGLGSLGVPGELPEDEFPALEGSLSDLPTGSDDLASGSEDLGPALGEAIEAGSAGDTGSDELGSENGDTGSDSASDELGSENGTNGSLSSGSLNPDDDNENGDDDASFLSSLEDIFSGSAEGSSGQGEDSSLEDIFGSDSLGSEGEGTGDEDEDDSDDDSETPVFGSGDIIVEGSLDSDDLMAIGSLAAVGIGVGVAVSGGLPPLPAVDVGIVCELPQEGIDFLKGNGSMEPNECLPEDNVPA